MCAAVFFGSFFVSNVSRNVTATAPGDGNPPTVSFSRFRFHIYVSLTLVPFLLLLPDRGGGDGGCCCCCCCWRAVYVPSLILLRLLLILVPLNYTTIILNEAASPSVFFRLLLCEVVTKRASVRVRLSTPNSCSRIRSRLEITFETQPKCFFFSALPLTS